MFTVLLTLLCLVQGPNGAEGLCVTAQREAMLGRAETPGRREPAPTAPRILRGSVELSPAGADAAARSLLQEQALLLMEERGRALMARVAPIWFPDFCRDQVLRRWLATSDPDASLRIIDQERVEHDHGSLGTSYRTALAVEADDQSLGKDLSRLRRQIPRAVEAFAVKCGGIAGFWALLALAVGWFDRLSRGYMTWRLRALGLMAGLAAPALVLFLA